MTKHSTSRPATREERNCLMSFLTDEYLQSAWGIVRPNDQPFETFLNKNAVFDYDTALVQSCIHHTVNSNSLRVTPNHFPDAHLMEWRVYDVACVYSYYCFKLYLDGKISRQNHFERVIGFAQEHRIVAANISHHLER